jgi:hypothetical protein
VGCGNAGGTKAIKRIRIGDFMLVKKGFLTHRYVVKYIDYFPTPRDTWHVELEFAPPKVIATSA